MEPIPNQGRPLAGRVALITWATGIGAACARQLAAGGASVFVVSIDGDDCRRLGAAIEANDGEFDWAQADLRREDEANQAVAACVSRFGRLDDAVAVVGGSGRRFGDGPLHEISSEAWDATLELNLRTAFLTGREALRAMLAQPAGPDGRGSIVFVTSVLATHPAPDLFATHAYAAAKGALVSLTVAMAARYAREGVRVNAVAPAAVESPMSERAASDPATLAYVARRQPLAGGFLPADDIASVVAGLVSPAARAVTGQVVAVDGGWSVTA